jgi:hypothetical protein
MNGGETMWCQNQVISLAPVVIRAPFYVVGAREHFRRAAQRYCHPMMMMMMMMMMIVV